MTIIFFLRADNNSTHFFLSSKLLLSNFFLCTDVFGIFHVCIRDRVSEVISRVMFKQTRKKDYGALLLISLDRITPYSKYWKISTKILIYDVNFKVCRSLKDANSLTTNPLEHIADSKNVQILEVIKI